MKKLMILCLLSLLAGSSIAQSKTENLVIITLDGFRWQEVFSGADDSLINDPAFSFDTAALKKKYWASTAEERRKKLLPFFWNTIALQGQLHGNRHLQSMVNVKNRYWFSYPGYNEMFTGYPDDSVNTNDKNYNKNTSVLEFLNKQPGWQGKIAAFASWDRFNAILNEPRSNLLVSSGVEAVKINTPEFTLLNEMQNQSPLPLGDDVRPDHLTYFMAKEYVKQYKPKVIYIAFEETDAYAHIGRYDYYLNMANIQDRWIGNLWNMMQQMPEYKNKTTMLILCDHGRGDQIKKEWTSHDHDIVGSDQIWLAAIGQQIEPKGEIKDREQLYQAQVAQTIARLVGFKFTANHPIDSAILQIIK